MATIKFFTKGTSSPKTIYLRLVHGRKFDLTKSTQLLIDPKYWNNKKGSVRQISEFSNKLNTQNDLNGLRNHVLNDFNDSYSEGQLINSDWLKNTINSFFQQGENTDFNYLVNYGEYFLINLNNKIQENGKIGVTRATEKKYRTIVNKLKEFEKYRKKRLKVSDVDLTFHKDFIYFLHDVQLLSYNTTGRYLKFVKTIVNSAKQYGLKVSDDIDKKEFRYPKEKTTFITLNNKEIEHIIEANLDDKPYLENARDWLVIGVWTGARVSDLLELKTKNIKNGFIEYTAKKTEQKIILPLHPHVREIVDRNGNEFPRKISSQRFNQYIKEVCKIVGFVDVVSGAKKIQIENNVWRKMKGEYPKWELVSSHICRRSFATNHYGKLPTPVIMAVTGHSTERMFLNYIGKTAKDNAEVLDNFWKMQENLKGQNHNLNILNST